MTRISVTKELGIIILAKSFLENLKIPVPRIISQAAEALSVSRKTGYKEARRIEKALLGPAEAEDGEAKKLKRENLLLRIRNQVLSYERDRPGVRFVSGGRHLPPEARSLCVRLLRDFRESLSLTDIANAIGVSKTSLSRWDKAADSECRFPEKPERRGAWSHLTPEGARRVLETFQRLKEDMTLECFTTHYNALYPEAPLDRRTITRVLKAAGLYQPEPGKKTGKSYHGKFKVFFPSEIHK